MSNSPELTDGGWQKPARVPEKSNFTHTCNLLSQYLKEKGSFGDLNLGVAGILEAKGRSEASKPAVTTMNLLTGMAGAPSELKSLGFFPQLGAVRSSDPVEGASGVSDLGKRAKTDPEAAQMTIFYAGKVMVFDDFPADKASEIMALASKGSPQNLNQSDPTSSLNASPVPSSSAVPNMVPHCSSGSSHCRPPQVMGPADMPIKRRNSLHRFLQKRKDRCNARAPYEVKPLGGASEMPQGSESMADMEAQSTMAMLKPPFLYQ